MRLSRHRQTDSRSTALGTDGLHRISSEPIQNVGSLANRIRSRHYVTSLSRTSSCYWKSVDRTGGWRTQQNWELNSLQRSSPNNNMMYKSRIRWVGYVTRIRQLHTPIWSPVHTLTDQSEDVKEGGRIILQLDFKLSLCSECCVLSSG